MKRYALLALVAIAALSACTPKEIETSQKAGEICFLGGQYRDSDGNRWSSQNCASHSRVCLANRPVQVSRPTKWCGLIIEPSEPTTTITSTTVPTSQPAENEGVEPIDGVRSFPVQTIIQEDQ